MLTITFFVASNDFTRHPENTMIQLKGSDFTPCNASAASASVYITDQGPEFVIAHKDLATNSDGQFEWVVPTRLIETDTSLIAVVVDTITQEMATATATVNSFDG